MGRVSWGVFARAAFGAASVLLSITAIGNAAPIAAGDLVILRVGGGSGSLGDVATAVFLDEYTPAGALVQSIAMPTTGTTSLTLSGTQSVEGILTRSQDGTLVTFAGYRKNVGGTNPGLDAATTTNRVIATLSKSGAFTTALGVNDVVGSVSSAATVDGSKFYLAGSNITGTGGGVRYINVASGTVASTTITGRSTRQAILTGNRLLVSNGSSSTTRKIEDYGALPTAGVVTPGTLVSLTSSTNLHGFFLADVDPAITGDDVMYLVNESAGQLLKYTFDGSAWQANGSIGSGTTRNVTGVVSGSTVTLYTTSPAGLSTLTDSSGIGGTLSGSLASIVSAPANTNFRGISVFVPEPSSATLILGLAAGLLLRRRRPLTSTPCGVMTRLA